MKFTACSTFYGRYAFTAGRLILIICGIILTLFIGYHVAFFTVDPSFDVKAAPQTNGAYRFEVSPNFVVNSVYRLSVIGTTGMLAERKEPVSGSQTIIVKSGLSSNDVVTIECDLQYDRIAPSITTKRKSVVLR